MPWQSQPGMLRKACHVAGFDDHVFQNFIDGMANVDVAIGVWRTVMENKFRATGTGFTDALIDFFILPFLNPFRFAFLARSPRIGKAVSVMLTGYLLADLAALFSDMMNFLVNEVEENRAVFLQIRSVALWLDACRRTKISARDRHHANRGGQRFQIDVFFFVTQFP
jgi:hypothetical protein